MKRHLARGCMEERVAAQRVVDGEARPLEETVAVEEPLEIHINDLEIQKPIKQPQIPIYHQDYPIQIY